MDERPRADDWVRRRLNQAAAAFRSSPPGPHDRTLEQYEQQLRGLAKSALRPTEQYLDLDLDDQDRVVTARRDAAPWTRH